MNFFSAMICCQVDSQEKIVKTLKEIMSFSGYNCVNEEDGKNTLDELEESGVYDFTPAKDGWVCIFPPITEWDELTEKLSRELHCKAFLFQTHAGDMWMYQFYVNGKELDKFSSMPDYWNENMTIRKHREWVGNAEFLARHFGIDAKDIEGYFRFTDPEKGLQGKVHTEDVYELGDVWVMTDFQRRFGIIYPDFDHPEDVDHKSLTFECV